MRTPEQYYEIYRDFKTMLVERVNVSTMHINSIQATCKIADLDKIHAITFIVYAYKYWYAYVMDILNGEYNYIHMTSMVWDSYVEHMSK